ncbi:hypothetical protein GCM10009785_07440 [Brooklawnia cerclae]|uniref:FHA domain-containing protein n=1 Tax=Brooklawnia cerclae TaxID=349934 RepID=A0ABX0SIU2_9ACTN|nr:FHA domain-containing protein [Brooklawnia cerclae]NIH58322.1 hypothetical protein [Brooklawnia cerclae]
MRTPFGAWRATYTPGRWVALSGPTSMVVLQPAPPAASGLFANLWDQLLTSASITQVSATLASFGLDSMPDLAVFFWDDEQVHCLLRGAIQVLDADSGEPLAGGGGAHTWYEASLTTRRIYVPLDEVDAGDLLQLPLVVGGAEVSAVFLDASTTDESAPAVSAEDSALSPGIPAPVTIGEETPDDAGRHFAGAFETPGAFEVVDEDEEAPAGIAGITGPPVAFGPPPVESFLAGSAAFQSAPPEPAPLDSTRPDLMQPDAVQAFPASGEPFADSVPVLPEEWGGAGLEPDVAVEPEPSPVDEPDVPWQPEQAPFGAESFGAASFEPEQAPSESVPFGAESFGSVPFAPQPRLEQPPAPRPEAPRGPRAPVEPTQVLGERPPWAPGQDPADQDPAEFGHAFSAYRGRPNTTGPWGAGGFAAPVAAGMPVAEASVPIASQVPPPVPVPRPLGRNVDAGEDHDGETVFTTGIAATHKPAGGRNSDNNLVLAALCPLGHPNAPGTLQCRICGGYVDSHNPQLVNTPLLAVLQTSTGDQVPLTGPVLIGRAPSNSGNDLDAELLRVPSPNHDISRTHVRVAPREWTVEVTDLYSTNGTTIVPPNGQPVKLESGQTVGLAVGGAIDLGDGQVIVLLPPV